eukprot:2400433-Pleurochrysis_carterae.AAC.1
MVISCFVSSRSTGCSQAKWLAECLRYLGAKVTLDTSCQQTGVSCGVVAANKHHAAGDHKARLMLFITTMTYVLYTKIKLVRAV